MTIAIGLIVTLACMLGGFVAYTFIAIVGGELSGPGAVADGEADAALAAAHTPQQIAARDILATDALIRLCHHLHFGKVDPVRLDPAWNIQRHMIIPEHEHALPTDRQLGRERPGIVHFMGPAKPWMPDTWHPWSWAYWDNLQRTPFLQQVADKFGMSAFKRFRLHLRWLRRGPR